jgi:hypothetical protein
MSGTHRRKGKKIGTFKMLIGKLKGRDYLGHLIIDGSIILKWIFDK